MRLFSYVPIKLAIFLVLGIVCAQYTHPPLWPLYVTVAVGLAIMGYLHFITKTTGRAFVFMAYLLTLIMGMISYQHSNPEHQKHHYIHLDNHIAAVWTVQLRKVLSSNDHTHNYIAVVRAKNNIPVQGKLLLRLRKNNATTEMDVDDILTVYGRLKPISGPKNPHQFNYAHYMYHQNVPQVLYPRGTALSVLKEGPETLYGWAAQARDNITQKLKKAGFKDDTLAVVQALFLGQRTAISETTYTNYIDAGAVHILALSGLHIGILLWFISLVLRPMDRLPYGRSLRLLVSVVLLWGFAFLAGLSASIIRACTMFTFVAYAIYLKRPKNSFNILALSVLFILLFINPHLIFQVGFQMSYAAVLAIVGFTPIVHGTWYPKNRIIRYIWQLLGVSIAAQLGVLPISLYYFHQFPGLFFISNLLLLPAIGLILGAGIFVIGLSLANTLPDRVAMAFEWTIHMMNEIVAKVAGFEQFIFRDIPFAAWQLVLGYLVVFSLGRFLSIPRARRGYHLLMTVLVFQVGQLLMDRHHGNTSETYILHQYGNAILLSKHGFLLTVHSADKVPDDLLKNYTLANGIKAVDYRPLKNAYRINGRLLLVLNDGAAVPENETVHTLLLSASPKIHLTRILEELHPERVIADGSNYPSFTARWKKSCKDKGIPFLDTSISGAIAID